MKNFSKTNGNRCILAIQTKSIRVYTVNESWKQKRDASRQENLELYERYFVTITFYLHSFSLLSAQSVFVFSQSNLDTEKAGENNRRLVRANKTHLHISDELEVREIVSSDFSFDHDFLFWLSFSLFFPHLSKPKEETECISEERTLFFCVPFFFVDARLSNVRGPSYFTPHWKKGEIFLPFSSL